MPWHIVAKDKGCPVDKPFAVRNADSGDLVACHPTQEKARAQLAVLYIKQKNGEIKGQALTKPDGTIDWELAGRLVGDNDNR